MTHNPVEKNSGALGLVKPERAKALLERLASGKPAPEPSAHVDPILRPSPSFAPIASSKPWWEISVGQNGSITTPYGQVTDMALAYCLRPEYSQGNFKAEDVFKILKALPQGVSIAPNSMMDHVIASHLIPGRFPKLDYHYDDSYFTGDYIVIPASGCEVGRVVKKSCDPDSEEFEVRFMIPDVKHPLDPNKGLHDAREILVFRLDKLEYDSDAKIVRVTQDFDPKTDLIVGGYVLSDLLFNVGDHRYPISGKLGESAPIESLRAIHLRFEGAPEHGIVSRFAHDIEFVPFATQKIFVSSFDSWRCVPLYSTSGEIDARLDQNLGLNELK